MIFELLYFVHLTGLGLWLGALVTVAWWTWSALGADRPEERSWGVQTASRVGTRLTVPTAAVVLGAGIATVVVSGNLGRAKPLWFQVMEQGGGMLAMLSVPLVVWLGRRLRAVAVAGAGDATLIRTVRTYAGTLMGVAVCVAAVLLAVSLRLS